MGAAPLQKPDEPAGEPTSDADGWALLEGLRRRLDDQAAQGRKTQNQVTQLADSIAALVAEQRRRSLWLNVNSFSAYLVFTILCAAGCYLLYQSRARELGSARDQAISERDTAVRRADDALARAVAREAADTKAWEVYQLLEAGQRTEAVAKLTALHDQPLSRTERAALAARVRDSQAMEVDAVLRAAAAAIKAGRPGEIVKPLESALANDPAGAHAAVMHYYLGLAYARTELPKAVAHFQAALAGEVDQDDARFQLASALDRTGAWPQARIEYDRFATAHPQSPFAMFAMRRSATLARAFVPGVVAPAGQGAAGQPAAVPPAAGQAAPPAAGASNAAPAGAPAAAPAAVSPFDAPHLGAPAHPGATPASPAVPPRPLRPWPKPAARPPAPAAGSDAPSDPFSDVHGPHGQ